MAKKLNEPTKPVIQSQNSVVQDNFKMMTAKKPKPATTIKENKLHKGEKQVNMKVRKY